MNAKCTWKDCTENAKHPLTGELGQWANLCPKHHAEYENALKEFSAPKFLRAYTLAQGGAKKAADRFLGPGSEAGNE